jgi:DNA repair ATPase RecN
MADKDYSAVLLEQLVDQNKAIREYVGEMPKISARLANVEQAVDELAADVKLIKVAIKQDGSRLEMLEGRVSALEAA